MTPTPRPSDDPDRGAAPVPQSLPALLATAMPYVVEVAKARRSLRERRARSVADQADDEQLLAAAFADLGAGVRKAGLRELALEPVLGSIAAAESRRNQAATAFAEVQRRHEMEDKRLAAEEADVLAAWQAAEPMAVESESILGETLGERQGITTALARLQETRQRFEAEANDRKDVATPRPAAAEARAFAEGLRRQVAALAPTETVFRDQISALDECITDLRARAEALRGDANAKRARYDGLVEARRQAAADLQTRAVDHAREQGDSERQMREFTNQLGQVAARTRPICPALEDAYARLDSAEGTIAARSKDIEEIDQDLLSFDKRKLRVGVAMLAIVGAGIILVALVAMF